MNSSFPGMDPYLEDPAFWSDFHHTFLGSWREAIADVRRHLLRLRRIGRTRIVTPGAFIRELDTASE